jgi:hypothetical protein
VVPSLRLDNRFPIKNKRLRSIIPLMGVMSFSELNDKFRIRTFGTFEAKSIGNTDNLIAANSKY